MTSLHHGRGNRNAAKPATARRVPLSLRVRPETRATLERMAPAHGSISRAVDYLAEEKNFPPISRGNAADCQS